MNISKKYHVKSSHTNSIENSGIILEEKKPLSKSMIWKLQEDFYANQGPQAWIKGIVPQYITTNPYIANIYAKTVFGYCRDFVNSKDYNPNTTIYIMELASGVGRFSFTFLKRFLEIIERSSLKELKFKYIITDLAERNVTYWLNHSYLKPYFEMGILDCATFDMTKDNELILRYSGEHLKKGEVHNPLILFANYTFDSLPQDTFYVNNGNLYEGLITLTSKDEEKDLNDKSILAGLDYDYTDVLLADSNYYEDEYFNSILSFYKEYLVDTAFSMPIIALRCMKRLIHLFNHDVVLISTDKGYRNISDMDKIYHPYLSKHGSISLTVNFHAMELFFNSLGGSAIHSLYDHESVTMSIFLLDKSGHNFIETSMAYYDIIESVGPDDFYALKKAIVPNQKALTTKELLTFLRYTVWDSRTFLEFYNTLLERISEEENFPSHELVQIIYKVWEHYFPIGEEGNLFYCLGTLLAYFGIDEDAIALYESSIEFYGEDAAIYYEIALCYYNLSKFDIAMEYIQKSLALESDFEESKNLEAILNSIK